VRWWWGSRGDWQGTYEKSQGYLRQSSCAYMDFLDCGINFHPGKDDKETLSLRAQVGPLSLSTSLVASPLANSAVSSAWKAQQT